MQLSPRGRGYTAYTISERERLLNRRRHDGLKTRQGLVEQERRRTVLAYEERMHDLQKQLLVLLERHFLLS